MLEKLIEAIEANNKEEAEKLANQIDVEELERADDNGDTALTTAAENGYLEICKVLISRMGKAAISLVTPNGNTALTLAAYRSLDEVCKLLIPKMSKDAINQVIKGGWQGKGNTALTLAAYRGLDEVCKLLIPEMSKDAINQVIKGGRHGKGNTALIYAAYRGLDEVCKLLISEMNEPDINAINEDGYTALTWAADKGLIEICNLLIPTMNVKAASAININGDTALICFLRSGKPELWHGGHTAICKLLISRMNEAAIKTVDKNGDTALILAAACGFKEICEALTPKMSLEAINVVNNDGHTALSKAIKSGHVTICYFIHDQIMKATDTIPTNISYIPITHFDLTEQKDSGGETGSVQIKDHEYKEKYQFKRSISQASYIEYIKACGWDSEIFAELIATSIARQMLGYNSSNNTEANLIPKVTLVYDERKNQFAVTSKYLDDVIDTLDNYAKISGIQLNREQKHVKISAVQDKVVKGTLNISEKNIFKQDLAQAIAISILSGDHDIHPGNIIVFQDNVGHRIARIDFGKAYNGLIPNFEKYSPTTFGGSIYNINNKVLDYLNRQTLLHIKPGGLDTKLWEYYTGVIPSKEIVNEFIKIGSLKTLESGINHIRNNFILLIKELSQDIDKNTSIIKYIKSSLNAVNENIRGEKLDVTNPVFIFKFFNNLQKYYTDNQKQMLEVARLMSLQLQADKILLDHQAQPLPSIKIFQKMINEYLELSKIESLKLSNNKIQWMKSSKDQPAFEGNLDEYIIDKGKKLNINTTSISNVLSFITSYIKIKDYFPNNNFGDLEKQVEQELTTNTVTNSSQYSSFALGNAFSSSIIDPTASAANDLSLMGLIENSHSTSEFEKTM